MWYHPGSKHHFGSGHNSHDPRIVVAPKMVPASRTVTYRYHTGRQQDWIGFSLSWRWSLEKISGPRHDVGGGGRRIWDSAGWEVEHRVPWGWGSLGPGRLRSGYLWPGEVLQWGSGPALGLLPPRHLFAPFNDACSCLMTPTGIAGIMVLKQGDHMGALHNHCHDQWP